MLHYHCRMQTGSEGSIELEGASSLEIALDRATERYRLGVLEGRSKKKARANEEVSMALVTTRGMGMPSLPVRLQWRGVEVSEEFQAYAARVALGEELAPYRGAVLARPCSEFQWSSFQPQQPSREATEPLAASPLAARSVRHAAWLFGMAGAMLAAIGLGGGAFSAQPSEGGRSIDSATVALSPVAPSVRESERTLERPAPDALEPPALGRPALDDEPSDELVAVSERPAASPRARHGAPSAVAHPVSPAAMAAAPAPLATSPIAHGPALAGTANDRSPVAAPAGEPTAAGLAARPAAAPAAPAAPANEGFRTAALGDGVGSGTSGFESPGASTLFSDQPPF
jgi:hypothetical protein